MSNPKVSVIVPVYNVEKYLDQCLESLVGQTYANLEIILIDDGATDLSGKMCDLWGGRDPRIKVVHKKNAGLGEARNTGLEHATGDYVGFVDSDDYVDTHLYERLVMTAVAEDADIVQCNNYREYNDGTVKNKDVFTEPRCFSGDELADVARALVKGNNGLTCELLHSAVWVCLFRRSTIGDIRYISERVVGSEDIPFKVSVLFRSKRMAFIPDRLCYYRYNNVSLTHTYKFDLFTRYITLTDRLNEIFLKNTGKEHQADYLVLYMAIICIRGMYIYNVPKCDRKGYFRALVENDVWSCVEIDETSLSKGEKLIYYCIRTRNIGLLRFVTNCYYAVRTLLPMD